MKFVIDIFLKLFRVPFNSAPGAIFPLPPFTADQIELICQNCLRIFQRITLDPLVILTVDRSAERKAVQIGNIRP